VEEPAGRSEVMPFFTVTVPAASDHKDEIFRFYKAIDDGLEQASGIKKRPPW
jgi:hypothetical protein